MDIRSIAFDIYKKSLDSAFAGDSFAEFSELNSQDAAFVKRLVLTALRRQEFIKNIIREYAAKKIPAKPDAVHMAIIMGAVEILYFRTPDYATVNSYVNLAKKKANKFAGGFVNAILHKICRDKEEIAKRAPFPFFPAAFVEILRKDYDKKRIASIEQAAVIEPALDITVKQNPEEWASKLGGQCLGNSTIRLYQSGAVNELEGFNEGCWWVQDFSSSLPVTILNNPNGKKVLDICAAPGGKTAQLISKWAEVTALDVSAERLKLLEQNLERLHLSAQKIIAADALDWLPQAQQFDIVLLDAPCSADGTLRRHPEIVHTRTLSDIRKNADLQKKLLDAAVNAVALNGTLIYSVCSMAKDEGERQIKKFLDSHPNFSIDPIKAEDISASLPEKFNELITKEGFIRCLPDMLGGIDGFFVARLKKNN